jgi:hypothetical protein
MKLTTEMGLARYIETRKRDYYGLQKAKKPSGVEDHNCMVCMFRTDGFKGGGLPYERVVVPHREYEM